MLLHAGRSAGRATAEPKVQEFWRGLSLALVKGDVLALPNGVYWMGNTLDGSHMLIRKSCGSGQLGLHVGWLVHVKGLVHASECPV